MTHVFGCFANKTVSTEVWRIPLIGSIRPMPRRCIKHSLSDDAGLAEVLFQNDGIATGVAFQRGNQAAGMGHHP